MDANGRGLTQGWNCCCVRPATEADCAQHPAEKTEVEVNN